MPMTSISAVIINHNRTELSGDCIESLKRQSLRPNQILLIDNDSCDNSTQSLRLKFPQIQIVENRNNSSFCAACNQGIRLTKDEFILLLNNDVVLDEHFIETLMPVMQIDGKIGMAGGKILSFDGETIDSAGQLLARSRKIIDRGYKKIDKGRYNKPEYVFSIGASAVLYRRAMLDDIREDGQYFDESFGFFYEDMDLAWRAQKKGWKVYYQPQAVAYHRRGATAKTEKPKFAFLKEYYLPHLAPKLQLCAVRNRYLMILKNDTARDVLKYLPFMLWYEIKQTFYLLLSNPSIIIDIIKRRSLFFESLKKRENDKQAKEQ